MPRFYFSCQVTVTGVTEVEAETIEEARHIAAYREPRIDGFGAEIAESWVVEEADGVPFNISKGDLIDDD